MPRYAAYKAHKNARLRVFRLKGSLYGQCDAPIRWYKTIQRWMVEDRGFEQSPNDVCLFRHPKTKLKVLLHVDDNKSRGRRAQTIESREALDKRFGLKHWSFLEMGGEKTFLGITLFKNVVDEKIVYGIHQNADVAAFVDEHMPAASAPVKSPMTDKHAMHEDKTLLGAKEAKSFRSILMSLSWFAQMTRLDIVCPVNILAQMSSKPTVSAMKELYRIVRYLSNRPSFTLYRDAPYLRIVLR
jgi:hypothetical protein